HLVDVAQGVPDPCPVLCVARLLDGLARRRRRCFSLWVLGPLVLGSIGIPAVVPNPHCLSGIHMAIIALILGFGALLLGAFSLRAVLLLRSNIFGKTESAVEARARSIEQ